MNTPSRFIVDALRASHFADMATVDYAHHAGQSELFQALAAARRHVKALEDEVKRIEIKLINDATMRKDGM